MHICAEYLRVKPDNTSSSYTICRFVRYSASRVTCKQHHIYHKVSTSLSLSLSYFIFSWKYYNLDTWTLWSLCSTTLYCCTLQTFKKHLDCYLKNRGGNLKMIGRYFTKLNRYSGLSLILTLRLY